MIADFMTGYMGKTALRGSSVGEELEDPSGITYDRYGKPHPMKFQDIITDEGYADMSLFPVTDAQGYEIGADADFVPGVPVPATEAEDTGADAEATGGVPAGGYTVSDSTFTFPQQGTSSPPPPTGPVKSQGGAPFVPVTAETLGAGPDVRGVGPTTGPVELRGRAGESDRRIVEDESWWDTPTGGAVQGFTLGAGVSALLNFMRGKPVSVRRMILMGIFAGAGGALYKHLGGAGGIAESLVAATPGASGAPPSTGT